MTAPLTPAAPRRTAPTMSLAVAAMALAYPLVLEARWLTGGVLALVLLIAGLGLHLLTGVTGQLSLGHAFFFGIGAVVAAWVGGTTSTGFSTAELWGLGFPVWAWLPAAAIVSGLAGFLVGPSAARLGGLSLGIVTLGLVFLGTHLFANLEQLSGGVNGRPVPDISILGHGLGQPLTVGPLDLGRDQQWFYFVLLLAVACLVGMHNLERSRIGFACTAVRDRDVAAAVLGVDVNRTKLTAFILGSALAGMGGALYGSYLGRIAGPEQFDLFLSLQFVVIVVIGGLGSRLGVAAGALFVALVPVAIDQVGSDLPFLSPAGSGGLISTEQFAVVLYGIALIVTLRVEPAGLSGIGRRIAAYVRAWPLTPSSDTQSLDLTTHPSIEGRYR